MKLLFTFAFDEIVLSKNTILVTLVQLYMFVYGIIVEKLMFSG